MKRPKPWFRILWAVRFQSRSAGPFLIGEAWEKPRAESYPGEPGRCLTFKSRSQARAWCRLARQKNSACLGWRFTAVRAVETVKQA